MTAPSAVPRYSDARVTLRWLAALIVLVVVPDVLAVSLLPRPEPALTVALLGVGATVAVVPFALLRGRLPRVEQR